MIRTIAPVISASETLRQIAQWRMSLTPLFMGKLWCASVELKGGSRHNRNRSIQTVEAIGPSPAEAVADLVGKLEPATQTTQTVVGAGEIKW